MDIERSIKFIWEDEEWIKKVLIAAVLTITGIGALAVSGWLAELARRSADDEEPALPEWDDLGRYFMIGLKYVAVTFVWALPVILLIVCTSSLSVLAFSQDDPGALGGVVTVFSICIYTLVFVYALVLSLMVMPLWVQLAEDTPLGDLINPASTWKLLRANFGGYLIVMLITWLATIVASLAGAVLCGIGIFFTGVIVQLFFAHLVGQATAQARDSLENAPAVPVE